MKAPDRRDDESEDDFRKRLEAYAPYADVELEMQLIPRPEFAEWVMARGQAAAEEEKRQLDNPRKIGFSLDGFRAVAELNRTLLRHALVRVGGIDITTDAGGRPSEEVTDPDELVALLEGCDLLAQATEVAVEAQSLKPNQAEP